MSDDAAFSPPVVSKSARKRAATSVQKLGEELAEFAERDLEDLELPESLLAAILQLRHITSRAAQLRQRQYIGKLMRHIDTDPIIAKLDARKQRHDLEIRRFQRFERWRDRLIDDPASALPAFFTDFPKADRAMLDRLISAARHQRTESQPPAAARELFVYIRSLGRSSA